MNKNWLYRVLALALVAMLALPMFALAEDVLPEQAESAAEAGELTLGEDEAVAKERFDPTADNIEVNLAYDAPGKKISRRAGSRVQIWVRNIGATNKLSFKSNNKKVAQVNDEGVLTCIDVGTAKITITGKTGNGKKLTNYIKVEVTDPYRPTGIAAVFDGSYKFAKKNDVANKDGLPFDWDTSVDGERFVDTLWTKAVKANGGSYNSDLGVSGLILGGDTIHVLPGEGWKHYYDKQSKTLYQGQLYFDVMAFNKDGLYLDGLDDPSDYADVPDKQYVYNREYDWKFTSGKDVVFADNAYQDGAKTSEDYWPQSRFYLPRNDWDYAPHLIFFKPGKATLKVTTASIEGNRTNSTNFKFVVDKNEKTFYKPTDKDLKTAIANDTLYYGVQSVKVKNMGEVEVTLFFVNGTDFSVTTLKDFVFGMSTGLLPSSKGTDYPGYWDPSTGREVTATWLNAHSVPFAGNYNKETEKITSKRTVKASIKRHKTTTVTLTFKSKYAWNPGLVNSFQLKPTVKNEVYEPFQLLDNPRFFYTIDALNFKLAAGFYNVESFNPTTGSIQNVEYRSANNGLFIG